MWKLFGQTVVVVGFLGLLAAAPATRPTEGANDGGSSADARSGESRSGESRSGESRSGDHVSATHQPAGEPTGPTETPRRLRGVLGGLDGAATRPWTPGTKFDASIYPSKSPTRVLWSTPTPQQTLSMVRPVTNRPVFPGADPKVPTTLPAPARVASADIRWFAFEDSVGDVVTGLLATPAGSPGPFPLVIATHGLLSHKMQVIGQVGPALLEKGFAVVAIDLPLHGERPGWGLDLLDAKQPVRMAGLWRKSVIDIREAMDVALATPLVENTQPVVAVGYSLGCWMSVIAGAADSRVGALALLVGGATEIPERLLGLPAFASSDPRVAIQAFAPRPVLLVSARGDRTVTPEMSDRLFAAAKEPKERRWYDMGHILKDPAYTETADWIFKTTTASPPPPQPHTPRPGQ